VIRFLKDRLAARKPAPFELGPLELSVMEIVWARADCSVRDVAARLDRPLAYTTVMTTLDRLYKKGLLQRQKSDRAFVYTATLSRRDWEQQQAGDLVAGLLANPRHSSEMLISCLVDAVGQHDESLLAQLEEKIRSKRRELKRRNL
jgi:predicted transcriptional regulator